MNQQRNNKDQKEVKKTTRSRVVVDDGQSLPRWMIRKLERTRADLDRRIDRQAAVPSRHRGKPTL